jgi:hypothetical protein
MTGRFLWVYSAPGICRLKNPDNFALTAHKSIRAITFNCAGARNSRERNIADSRLTHRAAS